MPTLLFISLLLSVPGSALVFDIGGICSRNYEKNIGLSPWGKKHKAFISKLPNPYRVAGWIFFLTGLRLLLFGRSRHGVDVSPWLRPDAATLAGGVIGLCVFCLFD